MSNRIYISAAVVFITALLGIIAYNSLEIYHETEHLRRVYPDRYYVLEQWLKETGNPVRVEHWKNLRALELIQEKTIVIYSSACRWEDAGESLLSWVKNGNSLVICIDNQEINEIDYNLWPLLTDLGIYVNKTSYSGDYFRGDTPHFAWDICFDIDENTEISTMKDNKNNIRLAEVSAGEGKLTVIGYPIFMNNNYMEKEANARLAWELTGERAGGKGVLFIRTVNTEKSLFGKIIERGTLFPLGISVFLVIITGFWMVIPAFGLVFDEKPKNSRPIQERFSAEAGFLKKYRALDYYIDIYNRELQSSENNENTESYSTRMENYNYRDIINKLRRFNDETDRLKRRIGSIKT
ncbi:MAG: hypothetical protein FWC19_08690 [Treponema sp.]|nr:hypothetical protein [Treponema sp.]MCL2272858.1 hypothetical protein [Treponema sp.]